jgi:hypothetical protein
MEHIDKCHRHRRDCDGHGFGGGGAVQTLLSGWTRVAITGKPPTANQRLAMLYSTPMRKGWIRFDRNELAGAFGDIGTDLPLIVGNPC